MNQEYKQLILKDLCARVPYHPKGHVINACNGAECDEWLTCATFPMFTSVTNNCRLYLRSMSSMTEEEKHYIDNRWGADNYGDIITYSSYEGGMSTVELADIIGFQDWLNAHHFDYRGLIPKGLAIEVTESNNPYKE